MIIGITGFAMSGKSTASKVLTEQLGYTKKSFAASLKEAVYILNPIVNIETDNYSLYRYQDAVDILGIDEAKTYPEVRYLLQTFGTDVARNLWGDNFWVNQTVQGLSESDNVVFDDVRFDNELEAVRQLGGKVIKITRDGINAVNSHISDIGIADDKCDIVIANNGLLEELRIAVAEFVKSNGKNS